MGINKNFEVFNVHLYRTYTENHVYMSRENQEKSGNLKSVK